MVDKATFEQLTHTIEHELLDGHMSPAFDTMLRLLDMLTELPRRNTIKQKVENLSLQYTLMMKQLEEYGSDPYRASYLNNMRREVFEQLLLLRYDYHVNIIHDVFSETAQRLISCNITLSGFIKENTGEIKQIGADKMDILFDLIWTSPYLTAQESSDLQILMTNHLDEHQQAYCISALTLSMMHHFDIRKLTFVSDFITSTSCEVKAKALIALCFATQIHAQAMKLYSDEIHDIKLRMNEGNYSDDLTQIQHFICLYQESERVRKRFENEIFPTLIRVTQQRHKLGFDDMEIDLTDSETAKILDRKTKRVLKDGLKEMARMFQEGMDINLSTFTSLKNFPFFHNVGHWLLPFDASKPDFKGMDLLVKMPICDSDKFSLYCLYSHMSPEQQAHIKEAMSNNNGYFEDIKENRNEFQNALQCLYRLIRRSPWTSMWPDVFTSNTLLIDNVLTQELLTHECHFLYETGMLLLRNKHYETAERHLSMLASAQGVDCDLLLKLGLCAQEQGKIQRAIRYYQQADMLVPQNKNVIYRLQYCYARLGQYENQLNQLLMLESMTPDDPHILTEVGLCYIQLKNWDEAEKRFYKLEFKGQRITPSLRALAWCAINKHDYELALKHYQRIFDETPEEVTWEDCINMGHAAWLMNDMPLTMTRYTEYAHRYLSANPEAKDALEPFDNDSKWLLDFGKTEYDLSIMHDLISSRL